MNLYVKELTNFRVSYEESDYNSDATQSTSSQAYSTKPIVSSNYDHIQQFSKGIKNDIKAFTKYCSTYDIMYTSYIYNKLELKYIKPLLNNDTGLIEDDLLTVLQWLYQNYGKVQSEEVKQKESKVLSNKFNSADPMVTLYCPIE